jgi:hypothetical protein
MISHIHLPGFTHVDSTVPVLRTIIIIVLSSFFFFLAFILFYLRVHKRVHQVRLEGGVQGRDIEASAALAGNHRGHHGGVLIRMYAFLPEALAPAERGELPLEW